MLGLLACWEGRTAIAQVIDAPMRLDALQQLDLQVEDRMSFRRLGIEDGLSQNAIYAMMQDRQGFIWMGTKDGLNRFDGYTFTVFRHNPFDQATLPGNYVTALLEDRDGALWVGTDGRGLGRLDPATGAVTRYAHSPRWRIMTLAQDARGNLWIGTLGGGVYRLAAEHVGDARARFEAFRHDPDDPNSLSHDNVRALLVDGEGAMWLGTEAGLDRMGAGGHLVRYHMESGTSSAGRSVGVLHEDTRGRLWVGTFAGLSRLDGIERSDGGTRARFTHFHEARRRRGFGWGRVDHIVEGPGGALWLATVDGLLRFDPETGRYARFVHDPIDPESLSANAVNTLLWDRTDVLWVGTNGYGLNRYDAKTDGFERIQRPHDHGSRESGFSIRSIFQDDEGYVWIGAGTLYRLDPRSRTLLSFETVSDRPEDFGNTVTWSITQDRRGYLWFAAEEGLYRYDPASQRIRRYAHDPADPGGLP